MKKRNIYRETNKRQDLQNPHQNVNEKGKGIEIDQYGFQKVHHKAIRARQNIFGNPVVFKTKRETNLRIHEITEQNRIEKP